MHTYMHTYIHTHTHTTCTDSQIKNITLNPYYVMNLKINVVNNTLRTLFVSINNTNTNRYIFKVNLHVSETPTKHCFTRKVIYTWV